MDSYQTFIEIFRQAVTTRNFSNLANVLKDGPRYFEIISNQHYESIVCSVFDKRNGLLCFLDYEFEHFSRPTNRLFDSALTEAFSFLKFFIEHFHMVSCFPQYTKQIKDVCQLALVIKCSLYIKKAACYAFTKLIELFSEDDLNLVTTIQKFITIFHLSDIKERKWLLCVLGKIIKHHGDVYLSHKCLNTIFRQLYFDAFQEYTPKSSISNEFYVYFDVFADMLENVQPSDEIREKFFRSSYEWIKNVCRPEKQQHVKVIRSAIDLLSNHMNQFQDLLYPDCKWWYEILWQLSHEKNIYDDSTQRAQRMQRARRALKTFYRIIRQILTDQTKEDSKNIILHFLEDFQKRFRNADTDLITLQLTVYGFSQLAALFKIHSCNFDIKQMYLTIASCALSIASSEQNNETQIQEICYYQNALSEMCSILDMTIEKINILVKLSICMIKRFPDLAISDNMFAVSSLIKVISNVESKSLLQLYLDNIIHDGIIWSCSHTLALDAELQQDLPQPPLCYKNYLPLWTELLNTERYHVNKQHKQLAQQVADTLMDTCITLINRLDIRIKRTNEDVVLSNVIFTHSAVNQTDFRIFVNLVDLYVDIINASELSLFANIIHKFLYNIIKLSYKHPLIPGFYKLVRIGMRILVYTSEEQNNEEEEEQEHTSGELQRTEKLLSSYLIHILNLIPTFSNELLIACLYLILDARLAYIENALSHTLPAFKIAFTIGLSNLELAYTALISLETWTQKRKKTNKLLHEIVPYLEPYLRSTESSMEILQDLTKAIATRKRVKHVDVIDTECTLHNFQRRVLLFLGSLDHDLVLNFVYERASRSTGASWDHKNLIKYTLPLPDAQPYICFDRMLPRIIALARESNDRRTKIAACEVLHSIITIIIGLTARHLSDLENSFTAFYGILCPTLLVLGSDSDEIVCSLFRPLALQLMRWNSRIVQIWNMRSMGEHIINSVFDGLIDNSNPALREFSGMCLAELTDWLIRETDENETQFNMIVQRINDFALHPSIHKRVAAAVAFNHLHVILSRDDDTVSIYWLEIFYCFVRSLDGCNDLSIVNALTYIEKVMKCKAHILNKSMFNRRKPHEFEDATLIHALYWLLSQCGVVNEHCRAKCMELYINISQSVTGSAQKTTQVFVETYGIDRLNNIILKGLESSVKDISVTSNIMSLLKALDCYVWLIEKQLLSVEELFLTMGEHVIFSCICNFVQQFWQLIKENTIETTTTSRKFEYQQMLQCKTLITMFNFLQKLLDVNINILPELLWDNALSALIIKCVMHPRIVGFDIKDIEMMDKLPHVLESLLKSMKSKYANTLPEIFKIHLSTSIQSYVTELLNLNNIVQNNSCDELIQHVNGLIMLMRCEILDISFLETSILAKRENAVEQIFKFLVNEHIGEWICSNLSSSMVEYLRALMEFQLSQYEISILISDDTRSMTETLVKLISNDTQIMNINFTKIAHGEYFLNTFKNVIYRYMLTHIHAIMLIFDTVLCDNPLFLLKWIEDMLLFLRQHKHDLQDYVDATVNAILQKSMFLENIVGNIDSRKERLMNIYGIAVRLKSKPTEIEQLSPALYQRILDQLTGDGGIEFKTQILRNFFVCLINETDSGKERLWMILRTLKIDARSLCPNVLSKTDVNAIKVIDCFETLLILLSTSKSLVILECVMHFVAGYGDLLFNDKLREHLHRYYQEASSDHVLRSLEMTYRAFMKADIIETERLELLRGFLLLAFEFCDITTIERFFKQNIHELHTIAHQNVTVIDDDDNDANLKQTIVSKIGCFQLITIMFAKIDVDKIIDANSMQNVSGQEQIGTELFKSLLNITKNTRALKIMRPECNELMRLLHCSAYNCSLAIIRAKNDERYYPWAFGENSTQGFVIWENIVDCNKHYNFGQIFKEYAKTRDITVNIRSTIDRDEQRTLRHAYTYSYDLSGSTLNEDINAYDLNKCVLLPYNSTTVENLSDPEAHVTASIALENGDFNEHECMSYICVFLRYISKNSDSSIKPKWLQFFCNALMYNQSNIKLFILKIISNTADEVFKPYAKFMLTPIIKATADYLEQYKLNYIVIDILEILTNWYDRALPIDDSDRTEAQRLFELFLDKVLVESSKNYNISHNNYINYSLKIIIEKWHSCLRVPTNILNSKVFTPNIMVHLILAFLENNMAKEIVTQDDILDFLMKQLSDWKTPDTKETSLICQCLGLYLKFLDSKDNEEIEKETRKCKVKTQIFAILGTVKSYQSINKQIKRIVHICRIYPQIAVDYINVVINAMAKNIARPYCLEIFALSMQNLDAQNIMNNLRHLELQSVLANRTSSCEEIGLKIVRSAVTIILPADLLSYVNRATLYVKDSHRKHRELVYDILMNVYKKYSADTTNNDSNVRTLLSISKQYLISGLLDPSQELQERILKFWAEETDFCTKKSKELLLMLLQKFSPQMMSEDAFASFMALLILQLATKSVNYTKNIFDSPLYSSCTFRDYNISVSWQRQNLNCMTPMFVDSLASQISYCFSFSQSVGNSLHSAASQSRSSHNVSHLTQNLQSASINDNNITTMDAITMFDTSLFEFNQTTNFPNRSLHSISSRNRHFRRSEMTSSDANRRKQIQKNMQQMEMIKQENVRQRNSVKLYRSYRNGDFPDIEICHSSLIKPLLQLIKLDQLICKDITVSLFCSLVKEEEKEESQTFRQIIVENLKQILHESDEKNNSFNAIILETLLQLNVTDCNPQDIVRISKGNSLNVIGILLLEQSLLSQNDDINDMLLPSPSKRMRTHSNDINEETTKWTQLVSLYKSLNDVDVVLSIFRERSFFGKDMQEAALSEVDGNWIQTKAAFARAYEQSDMISSMKEHCLQGLFEAMNNLCDWSKIDQLVKKHANGNLTDIWDDAWKDWMLPYVCDAYVHMWVEKRWSSKNEDLTVIQSWMRDPNKLEHLKLILGEDLVMFSLNNQDAEALRDTAELLNDLLDKAGKQWIDLNPLCTELGIRNLQKLQAINDLDVLLKIFRCTDETDYLTRMITLLDFWSTKTPTVRDSLIYWRKLADYRRKSAELFERRLHTDIPFSTMQRQEWRMDYVNHKKKHIIRNKMRRIDIQLRLDIADAALYQKHRYIAENHLKCLKSIRCLPDTGLKTQIALLEAKIECLRADIDLETYTRISNYTASWERSHRLLNESDDVDMNIAIRKHISILALKIESLIQESKENQEFVDALASNSTILHDIGIMELTKVNVDQIKEQLLQYSLNNLSVFCEHTETNVTNIGQYYYTLAKHCYIRLINTDMQSEEIFQKFLLFTLKSTYHDYLEAMHYFPCLLRSEQLQNEQTREAFVQECAKLQPWLFLRWQNLLFSHLATPSIAAIIAPIVEKLAYTYPDAVVYTYYLTIERNPNIFQNINTQPIHLLLRDKIVEYKRFLQAIQYVAQPELYLKYYLNKAAKELSLGKAEAVKSLLQEIQPIFNMQMTNENNPRPGDIYNKLAATYEREIRTLDINNSNAAREGIRRIKDLLNKEIEKQIKTNRQKRVDKNRNKLKYYSPFLHEYTSGSIEVPGQYTGDKEPMLRYHAKIARFEPNVIVMQSLRKPIRIGIIGDNGKEYKFLVKFGEDLTIDHGLQQLYTTMNRTLRNDASCRQRRLNINTYEVIPLSRSFGLIQWIEDTKSLEDLVQFTLSEKEKEQCKDVHNMYMEWIANAASSRGQQLADQYKKAVNKYNQSMVTNKMKVLINKTPRIALREAFAALSPTWECFVMLRRNFITSYATMCVAHWITGIGDRHLQNTLVHVTTGQCLGIDFGCAFDSSIHASIPELVPFRLTPQILELLRPFTEQDLLATIMTHVMRTLRADRGPILACMDIFIHKPTRRSLDSIENENVDTDLIWSSKRNIEIVAKKLNGIHPSLIMLEQLEETHNDEYFPRYRAIVTGNDESKKARANKDNYLTPAEQVNCLLDQAKDLNVLGRMYANWQPWL